MSNVFAMLALGGCGWLSPRSDRVTAGKDAVPVVQEAECTSGSVWTGTEDLVAHRDSILRPSSPYRVANWVFC